MEYQVHDDFSALDAQEWNTLAVEGLCDVPFLRYEYLQTWWQTRGGGEWPEAQLMLISARSEGRLVGIAPLFLAEHDGRLALLLVGSVEISDYLDLIVRPADLPEFLSGLLDFLAAHPAASGRPIDWYNLPEASPTLAALRDEAARRAWTYHEEIYRPTPAILLPEGGYEAYLAGVDKKQRHEIRRKVRRAEESGRGVRWYLAEPGGGLDIEIDAFLKLMEADANKAAFLSDPMREQMRQTIQLAAAQGWLWLAFLEVDGRKAAGSLNFDYQNKLWGYNSGVDRSFMDLSPGWVLLAYSLQWAAENKRSEFDFMRGDEEYKYRFGAVNRHVMRARLTPAAAS